MNRTAIKNFSHQEKHNIFLSWAEKGHAVFVSGFNYEFEGKPQYEIVWEKIRKTQLTGINENRTKEKVEQLAFVKI